jgi:hypothetical protein
MTRSPHQARTTLVIRVTFKVDVEGANSAELIAAAEKAGEDTMHPLNPSCEPEAVEVLVDRVALERSLGERS